jgi:allophanate hydrolase/aspartyl-tRNA(Asn)/glutamyl-tRNA(Gln) amidotransferase subunit A
MDLKLDFQSLRAAYDANAVSPSEVIAEICRRIEAAGDDGVWISRVPADAALAQARKLETLTAEQREGLPLFGLTFGVKDCIDVAGQPTTCACPEFAYTAERSASSVDRLIAAGAIYIGKTNLDQFATGLVGTRSPYGVARNPFNADYIPGGSSSGSAVAVAAGLVSFALGTDTGGSGRVPGSYNNICGLKPSVGRISPRGLVNACRTIDCISVYALTGADAMDVLAVAEGYEPETAFSRKPPSPEAIKPPYEAGEAFTFGVPVDEHLEFFGDPDTSRLFEEAIAAMEALGGKARRIDYSPMLEVNPMMFFGPLVAERYASVGKFLQSNPGAGDPVVRGIIEGSQKLSAVEAFEMIYRLEEIKRQIMPLWTDIDLLMAPTVGHIWKVSDIAADPLGPNFRNGYYTNFVNPLDLAAVATPNGFARDGVPVGVTLIGKPWSEAFLASLGDSFSGARVAARGA